MAELCFQNLDAQTITSLFNKQVVHYDRVIPDEMQRLLQHIGAPLVILDLETTGLSPKDSEIFEVALLKISLDGSIAFYTQLIDPQSEIPKFIQELCGGVTRGQLLRDGAQHINKVAPFVLDSLAGCCLSGFNVRAFDKNMLEGVLKKHGHKDNLELHSILDVRDIWKSIQKTKYGKLGDVCRWYDIKQNGAHRACFDVSSTYDILNAMLRTHPDNIILNSLCDTGGNRIRTPTQPIKMKNSSASTVLVNQGNQNKTLPKPAEIITLLLNTEKKITRALLENCARENSLEFNSVSFAVCALISSPDTDINTVQRFSDTESQEIFDSVFNETLFATAEKSGRPLTFLRDGITKQTGKVLDWNQIHVGLRRHNRLISNQKQVIPRVRL